MNTRLKFVCSSVHYLPGEFAYDVVLDAVKPNSPANARCAASIPFGSLLIRVTRDATPLLFAVGLEYYLNITPAG